jgi:hypothetical protein
MSLPEGHAHAPGGPRHHAQLHRVQEDHVIEVTGDKTLHVHAPDGDVGRHEFAVDELESVNAEPGWIGFADWTNDDAQEVISAVRGTLVVPDPPENVNGQTLFLFVGLQKAKDDPSELFQPVLQWGESAAGGGDYWSVSNWYLKDRMIVFGDNERVEPGELLELHIERTEPVPGRVVWVSRAAVCERGVATTLQVMDELRLHWCYSALEAYSAAMTCDQYPAGGPAVFRELVVERGDGPVSPRWSRTCLVTDCGQDVRLLATDQVDIHYRGETETS